MTRRLEFPPATSANRDGLVAVGGDLSRERLLLAYRSGIFPWPIFDDDLMTWFSPDPRAVLDLDTFHIPRSLQKFMKRARYRTTFDQAFGTVIAACAEPGDKRPSTWITKELERAYVDLHEHGYAHSVECWQEDALIGGLYGVTLRGLFAGESMFSKADNASKVALVALVEHLRARGFRLFDIQQATPHMVRMGATDIPRREYLARLRAALEHDCRF